MSEDRKAEVQVRVAVHHPSEPWLACREVSLSPEQLAPSFLPAALSLNADVLHDGGAMFGTERPLFRLEARTAGLPGGWTWEAKSLPPLPEARPWQRPGWFAGAWRRLRAEHPEGPARVISSSDLNAVLSMGEGGAQVFLKVGSGQEARVTAALAHRHPGLAPEVLVADLERGELLTRYGGQTLDTVTEIRGWTAAAEVLAQHHRSPGLNGVPHHPFAALLERGEVLLRNEAVLRGWGMNVEQCRELIAALPELQRLWRRVDALQLPDGPVHGDIHPKNALWDGQQARLFDWSEAGVAHPLTDSGWFIGHFVGQKWPLVQAEPDLARKLATAYLNALGLPGAYAEMAAAVPLALLQRAVVYDATFREWAPPRPNYVPYYLRRMLSALRMPSLTQLTT